jgi:hypothetical protein
VLPLHPLAPIGDAAAPEGGRGRIRALVLTSLSLAVLAVEVGTPAALLVLALAGTGLGAAAVLGLRARSAAVPAPAGPGTRTSVPIPVASEPTGSEDLTARLRQLHDDHVEMVNLAVSEGREDLVQELADSYTEQALGLMTGGGFRSPDHFPAR